MSDSSTHYELSDQLTEALTAAGWSPERQVDTSSWARAVEAEGIPVSPVAHDFWQSFGGLKVLGRGRYKPPLELDPTEALHLWDPPERWESEYQQSFCPMGVWDSQNGLWVGDRGHVMIVFTEFHEREVATSPMQALESLLVGEPGPWKRWLGSVSRRWNG
ncbi:SUKH-3 domain-containing protein [Actinoplanes rectilineatus]|uniref:SUKH-3 domain-containing protein n=1 Tax=Actinoplanes rectilineatus TaxID=113571 RepID=UPI0005F2E613|nr:SUKH-3 domain-containing protein [Actinoplanes rectilineatus]